MRMPRPESETLGFLYDRLIGDDPERVASYERALTNAEVATAIYELRTEAGLSQRALAERVGTTASVICRLEDADYDGHSLSMLRRVADAVGRRVAISFPPKETTKPKTTGRVLLAKAEAPGTGTTEAVKVKPQSLPNKILNEPRAVAKKALAKNAKGKAGEE
jgi:transcriptional regulator with XRE-family HTH domain